MKTELEVKLARVQAAGLDMYRTAALVADAEHRPLSEDERGALLEVADIGRALRGEIWQARGVDPIAEEFRSLMPSRRETRSIGTQFIESAGFEFFRQGKHRGGDAWESPVVDVSAAAIGGDPTSPMPVIGQVIPMRPLSIPPTIGELFAQGRTTANAILYPREVYAAMQLSPTAPGTAKAQTTMTWQTFTAPVVKQAGFVPISEELFEDLPGLAGYIDSRLLRAANLAVDLDLYNQISTLPGRTPDHALTAGHSNADALLNQAVKIFTASLCIPDAIVLHPLALWGTVGQPSGQELVGAGTLFENNGLVSLAAGYLYGMRLVPSAALPVSSTAVVGAFADGAGIFWRDDFAIQVSNSHLDWFQKNLLALRGERRYAFCPFLDSAFGMVTGLNVAT